MKEKIKSVHEIKMKNRVMDKIKLSGPAWNSLLEDFRNKMPKRLICAKYNIKSGYYKWVKKIITKNL